MRPSTCSRSRSRLLALTLATAYLLGVPVAVRATAPAQELDADYRSAPKKLPEPGANAGLLLATVVVRFPMGGGQLAGAALVATDSTAHVMRAKPLARHVVLFPDTPPGVHALRFIIVETANARMALEVPPTSDFTVSVPPGEISYLGTVTVQKKMGLRPPEIQLAYDVERERESWAAFLKKYPDSPWSDRVRARLDSLGGPQSARAP